MIMKTKTKQGYKLSRVHSKIGEIITWDVLSNDGKVRIAVIRKLNDHWIYKRVSWQEFPIKYWLATIFYEQSHLVGNSRESVLNQLMAIRKP